MDNTLMKKIHLGVGTTKKAPKGAFLLERKWMGKGSVRGIYFAAGTTCNKGSSTNFFAGAFVKKVRMAAKMRRAAQMV